MPETYLGEVALVFHPILALGSFRFLCRTTAFVGFFYFLPTLQDVLNYQTLIRSSGDQDLCYFNYRCIQPCPSFIEACNNFLSNFAYVILGVVYLLIVAVR